jgi:hypothetical protein
MNTLHCYIKVGYKCVINIRTLYPTPRLLFSMLGHLLHLVERGLTRLLTPCYKHTRWKLCLYQEQQNFSFRQNIHVHLCMHFFLSHVRLLYKKRNNLTGCFVSPTLSLLRFERICRVSKSRHVSIYKFVLNRPHNWFIILFVN